MQYNGVLANRFVVLAVMVQSSAFLPTSSNMLKGDPVFLAYRIIPYKGLGLLPIVRNEGKY